MFDLEAAWQPHLDWDAPAGIVLRELVAALPTDRPIFRACN